MSTARPRRTRWSAWAVSAGTLGCWLVAVPSAGATTGPVAHSCTTPMGSRTLVWEVDTAAPAPPAGTYVERDVALWAATTVPGDLAKQAKGMGADTVSATVTATVTDAAGGRTVVLSAARTPLGDQTAPRGVPLRSDGVYRPSAPGDHVLRSGALTATLTFGRSDGTTAYGPVDISCAPPPGQQPAIDTVSVRATSATTLVVPRPVLSYGEGLALGATVSTGGGAPAGGVAFVLDGLATRAGLDQGAAASTVLRGLAPGVHRVSATFLPTDPAHYDTSTTSAQTIEVARATTSTRVRVAGKRTGRRTALQVRVRSAFDTTATGRVRVVLVRSGAKGRTVEERTLREGRRSVGLGRLVRGRYRLSVTYRGDGAHLGSTTVERFRVRRG